MTLDPDLVERLRGAEEIILETRAGSGRPRHRTPIWVVVDDEDRVLVRTYLGPATRWYREAVAHPECVLEVGSLRVSVRAVAASDPERVAAASAGYRSKYASDRAAPIMVATQNLPTTLELVPR